MNDVISEEPSKQYGINSNAMPIGHGVQWISEAFTLFMKAPWMWIGLIFLLFIIAALMSLVPVLGQIAANLTWPVFIAGLMSGCVAVDHDEPLTWSHLFKGFEEKPGQLIGLGATYLGLILAVVILIFILSGLLGFGMMELMQNSEAMNQSGSGPANEMMIILFVLIMFGLTIPIMMATWFAPALIMLRDTGILQALKLSFIGCLKNILPLLLYGIVLLVLMIVAAIPLGLGFIVLMPIICLSLYTAYRDIYTDQ